MKTLNKFLSLLVIVFTLITVFSCRKDDQEQPKPVLKTYAELTLDDIKAKENALSTAVLVISDAGGIKMKAGDIILYKTQKGKYGKMEVIAIDAASNYKIKVKAMTYVNENWTEYITSNALEVRGTWYCDLDYPNMKEVDDETLADFKNERLTNTDTKLTSKNGAKFMKYNF